ncbi:MULTISPECIES: ABC transporter permease [Rhizobium]|uniref:ABC transporter permease n=1 Tax=Rhizobium TaxID=379 RepID=UPI000A1E5713|nr:MULTISPECIES: ABC transporter permease [Rhizobium]ARM90944.1 ribose ABC transporter permease protein RbsC 3 [Rhizobium sp. CIAT894]MBB4299533.1 ribose/xylose/arabinose/galactoside ABC-type transport system permease subunit [Rhizobium leguminosarum]MBB4310971.1 ribose/xylose/arabinose/galactoside ABC-type transport system permease subunit [Rhizobium leguminosarum]MBB4419917.1 ribose/xylose/arabinose/galactoside ABC-type transport system permease subunit [Rhizobium leguminosarum]MBB4435087.1 
MIAESPASSKAARTGAASSSPVRRDWMLKYSTLFALILLFLGFALTVDRFLTTSNLLNIIQQISMLTIVGAGLTFGFAAREMDLSVGYMVGLAGILVPLLLISGVPLPLALLAGIAAGFAVGAVNSALVTLVGVPSLIATLATGSILYGINFLMTGGRAIYGGLPEEYLFLGQGQLFGIPVLAYFMVAFVVLAWFLMERTIFGRYIYAVGGNLKAAELSGVNGRFYRAAAMIVCSVFAGIAGALLAARLGSGQPNAGERYLLDGLATVFIGMTMFRPGTATIAGTFFGALFIGVINNGLNLIGMDTYIQSIVKGLIILIAVAIVSRTTKLKLL